MPTPTYDLIEEKVLGSASASVTFSSIPGTYKDLVLEVTAPSAATTAGINIRFNGDTGSNYSWTELFGNGTTTSSSRSTNQLFGHIGLIWNGSMAFFTAQIMSYANTNVNKTALARRGSTAWGTQAMVNLWRSTAAITSLEVFPDTGGATFPSGTTLRLWGVAG